MGGEFSLEWSEIDRTDGDRPRDGGSSGSEQRGAPSDPGLRGEAGQAPGGVSAGLTVEAEEAVGGGVGDEEVAGGVGGEGGEEEEKSEPQRREGREGTQRGFGWKRNAEGFRGERGGGFAEILAALCEHR
jgi:hypothetical protein